MARKKSTIILTEKQAVFVEAILDGKPNGKAMAEAGYSPTQPATTVLRSPDVAFALETARSELSSAVQIKRGDMIQVLVEAIDMSRMMADPMGMIAGAREVGKMLGLYEPEKKSIELTTNQARLRSMYEALSDEELLNIIEGESRVLDS